LAAGAGRCEGARARPRRAAARSLRGLDGPVARLDARPPPGRDRAARVLPPVRPARRRARTPRVAPPLGARPVRRARPDGADLRRRRGRAVDHVRRFLEPEAARRQHLRAVLPGPLALLGPPDLRALPRRRDARLARGGALDALAADRARSGRGDRGYGRGPGVLVLAVELRGAGRRRPRSRGLRVAPARAPAG